MMIAAMRLTCPLQKARINCVRAFLDFRPLQNKRQHINLFQCFRSEAAGVVTNPARESDQFGNDPQ